MKKTTIISVFSAISIFTLQTGIASAWHYEMSGSGKCQPDGSYKITWNVDNESEPTPLEIKQSSNTAVVSAGDTIPANQSKDFYQTVDGTKPGTYKLELTADWKEDRSNMMRSATVTLDEACSQPTPEQPETPQTPETPTGGRGGQVLGEQVTVVPVGPVSAGEGAQSANPAIAIIGLLASTIVAGFAIFRAVVRR